MPPVDHWDEEDEWYRTTSGARHVRAPPAPQPRRQPADYLGPDLYTYSSGLHRTRSQGHSPVPNVTIYNTLDNETSPNVHTEQKGRAPSPRGRTRRVPGGWELEDEIAELRHKMSQQERSRSRSRSGHHHHDEHAALEYERRQRQLAEDRIKENEYRLEIERREDLLRRKLDLEHMKDQRLRDEEDARIKRDEARMKQEWQLQLEQEERKRLLREQEDREKDERMKREWEMKFEKEERLRIAREREAEESRKRIIAEETAKREHRERDAEESRKRIIAEEKAKRDAEERERLNHLREAELDRKRILLEEEAKKDREEREAKDIQQRAIDQYNKEKAEKERKAKEEHARFLAEQAERERKAKEEHARILAEQAERERKVKEENARIVAEYEAKKVTDAAKAKRELEELKLKLRLEEEAAKQKEKEEEERFLLKQQKKAQEEKEKQAQKEAEIEAEMRSRLAKFGLQDNQIQAMIKPDQAQHLQQGMSPHNPLHLTHHAHYAPTPTFVRVSKEHLSIETLHFYEIPYKFDEADPNFIVILQEMDNRETEILFEHTRHIRSRRSGSSRLLIEERHDRNGRNDYAWVRRRQPSRSPSRRRSSPKRNLGLKEMFF